MIICPRCGSEGKSLMDISGINDCQRCGYRWMKIKFIEDKTAYEYGDKILGQKHEDKSPFVRIRRL